MKTHFFSLISQSLFDRPLAQSTFASDRRI